MVIEMRSTNVSLGAPELDVETGGYDLRPCGRDPSARWVVSAGILLGVAVTVFLLALNGV